MQPSPSSETSRVLLPSLRFFIAVISWSGADIIPQIGSGLNPGTSSGERLPCGQVEHAVGRDRFRILNERSHAALEDLAFLGRELLRHDDAERWSEWMRRAVDEHVPRTHDRRQNVDV